MSTGIASPAGVSGLWKSDHFAWHEIVVAPTTPAGQWIEQGFRDVVPASGDLVGNGEIPDACAARTGPGRAPTPAR